MNKWIVFCILAIAILATPGCFGKTRTSVNDVLRDPSSKRSKFVGVVEVFSCLEPSEDGTWCKVADYGAEEHGEIWMFNGLDVEVKLGDVIDLTGKIGVATTTSPHGFEEDVLYIDAEGIRVLPK
ncbi:MAG: hypothetical protein ACE5PM_07705 [Candidatus Hydrothermarchaeales archaeon]